MLKRTNLSNAKQLSEIEMKKILGGYDPVVCNCNNSDDCANKPGMTVCVNGCGGQTGDKFQGNCDSQ
jgi:natural product precursor